MTRWGTVRIVSFCQPIARTSWSASFSQREMRLEFMRDRWRSVSSFQVATLTASCASAPVNWGTSALWINKVASFTTRALLGFKSLSKTCSTAREDETCLGRQRRTISEVHTSWRSELDGRWGGESTSERLHIDKSESLAIDEFSASLQHCTPTGNCARTGILNGHFSKKINKSVKETSSRCSCRPSLPDTALNWYNVAACDHS